MWNVTLWKRLSSGHLVWGNQPVSLLSRYPILKLSFFLAFFSFSLVSYILYSWLESMLGLCLSFSLFYPYCWSWNRHGINIFWMIVWMVAFQRMGEPRKFKERNNLLSWRNDQQMWGLSAASFWSRLAFLLLKPRGGFDHHPRLQRTGWGCEHPIAGMLPLTFGLSSSSFPRSNFIISVQVFHFQRLKRNDVSWGYV